MRPVRGCVLHAPAFAEEMNKSRRMVTLTAQAMARNGWVVLVPDLVGTGDSPGDLSVVNWIDWVDDLERLACWMQGQDESRGGGRLWIWGLRTGALLSSAVARRLSPTPALLWWQPFLNGKVALQQFLRIASAGQLNKAGAPKPLSPSQQLDRAGVTEVGGYLIGRQLAEGLAAANLDAPDGVPRVEWMDVVAAADLPPSPASAVALDRIAKTVSLTRHQRLVGVPFWTSVEIECVGKLVDLTPLALEHADGSR